MKYKLFPVILLIFFLASCKNSNYHMGKCANWDTIVEPFENVMPDSLKYLIPTFKSINNDDQAYRCSPDKTYFTEHTNEQRRLDSINQKIVLEILNKYGFRGQKQFGLIGYYAITSTIQHSTRRIQDGIYPIYVKAVFDNILDPQVLAMLEDRINIHHKRKQYFGTQLFYNADIKNYQVFPLHNPDSVEIYRKQIGLNASFKDYVKKTFKINWDVADYKQKVETLQRRTNITDSTSLHYNIHPYPDFIDLAAKKLNIGY